MNQSTGVISGTPILPASQSSFTVRVQDAGGQSDTQALSITISLFDSPNITTTTLQGGIVGKAYSQTLQATGGIGARTWTLASGSLPAMLSLSPAGVIPGTPTNAGPANFTVRVADTFNQSDTQDLSITVIAALEITTVSLPNANDGQFYRTTLQSSGGTPPVSWSVNPPLPNGLSLNQVTGEITGTTSQGTFALTFTAQDSAPTPTDSTSSLVC